MSSLGSLGIRSFIQPRGDDTRTEHRIVRRPLQRVLAFRGRSIHDVVNDPVVKNEILGFYKLDKHIIRRSEIIDLERQWNCEG